MDRIVLQLNIALIYYQTIGVMWKIIVEAIFGKYYATNRPILATSVGTSVHNNKLMFKVCERYA